MNSRKIKLILNLNYYFLILINEINLLLLILLLTPLSNEFVWIIFQSLYIHRETLDALKCYYITISCISYGSKKPETRTASSPFNVADLCIQKLWRRFSWLFVSFKWDRMLFLECEQCNSLNGNIHDWFMFLVCCSVDGWLQWYIILLYQINLKK